MYNPKAKRIVLTKDMMFLQKSYWDYNKIQKPILVNTSYEGSDDEEKVKVVLKNYQNSNKYI